MESRKWLRPSVAVLLFLCAALMGAAQQALSITGAPASVAPGATFTFTLNSNAAPGGWSGEQFTISLANATIQASAMGSGTPSGKYLSCAPAGGVSQACVVVGAQPPATAGGPFTNLGNASITSSGPVVTVTAKAGGTGPVTVALSGADATDPSGTEITLAVPTAVTIPVVNKCDLDNNGVVDGADVGLQVSWVLGTALPPVGKLADRNGDGKSGIQDVEIVLNAALPSGVCSATQ